MKWPVALFGAVLVAAVALFAVTYGEPSTSMSTLPQPVSASSTGSLFGTTSQQYLHSGGVEGRIRATCLTVADDLACVPQIRTIQAYQGIAPVALFKASLTGTFRAELPPGQYELRVEAASSTRCVSIGVVVPEKAFISANISCDVGTL